KARLAKLTQQVRRSSTARSDFSSPARARPLAGSIVDVAPRPQTRQRLPTLEAIPNPPPGALPAARARIGASKGRTLSGMAGVDRSGVAELGPDVAKVDPPDIGHALAAGRLGLVQGVDKLADVGVLDRVDPLFHQVVEGADEDRHDCERGPAAEQVLQEHDL